MASKTVKVASAVGLHARPAALVAQAAGEYDEHIFLSCNGRGPVDASSLILIMTLGATQGAEVTIESENAEAVVRVAALIESDLDAEATPEVTGAVDSE